MFTAPRRAFAALFIGSCMAFAAQTAMASTVTVSGTVTDKDTGRPVAGAKVELTNANAGTGYFIGHTGQDGKFSFANVRPNLPYDLAVFAQGYTPYEMNDWSIPENQESVELNIELAPGAAVEGTVTASDGETPIQNAKVELVFERGDFRVLFQTETVFTGENGAFRFEQLPSNIYSLNVTKGGYIPERLSGVRPIAGEDRAYSVKLYEPANIQGHVRLKGLDTPLPDIEVMARGASQETGTSDENGFFSIENLKPGAYKLFSQPGGFDPFESGETIQIGEGESKRGVTVNLVPLPPNLTLNGNRDVFLPGDDIQFQIRTFRIGQYENAIHPVPASMFTENRVDPRNLESNFDLSPIEPVRKWTTDVEMGNPYRWIGRDANLKEEFGEPLPPGAYVYEISAPEFEVKSRMLFFVTELGVVTKRGETKTFVYATDLKTGMPVASATVYVSPPDPSNQDRYRRHPNWTENLNDAVRQPMQPAGQTGEDGILFLEQELNATADVIAVSPNGFLAVSPLYRSSYIASGQSKIFAYTDRPIYRPGHEVFYKAILRGNPPEGFEVPDGADVSVTVRDSRGDEILSERKTAGEWGSIDGTFEIPANAPLGRFTIEVKHNEASDSIHFYVEEYRKPEFRVSVESERPYYINGEEVRFNVRSEYYYGAPLQDALARYRIYETPASSGPDRWQSQSFQQYLSGGETTTDAEGIAVIEFTPRRGSVDRKITLEVEVQEASGRRVNESAWVPVGVGEFWIEAESRLEVYDGNTPIAIEIATRDHENKPVSAEVTAEFLQEVWSPVRKMYVRPSRPFASFTVTTDEEGKALVEWLPDTQINGRFDVEIAGTDPRGNRVTGGTRFWRMGSEFGSYDYQYPTLEGILDKDEYAPGDEAVMLVNTQYPEYPIILTIEGRDILSHRVIWPNAKTMRVTIPVLEEYGPNVYVGLFMPRGQRLSNRSYKLNVPAKRGEMDVTVETDRETYKPGDTGRVTVKTALPDGTPAPAEVSLAVVDEAIFALRRDHTPDIHRHFYGDLANWVSTSYSYPIQYYGGADKGVRPDIRKDFRDTAAWFPSLRTGETGEATAEVTFPDNLTSWRMTARGHTRDTHVGWTKANATVTKELIASLSLPRFFTEGDEVFIPASVNNLTGDNLPEIKTQLGVSGGAELAQASQTIMRAAAGAQARESFKIAVPGGAPEAVFVFEAEGREDTDGLELRAPVLPLGYAEDIAETARVENATGILDFSLDENVLLDRSSFEIVLTPSPAAAALGAIDYLTGFPFGCAEQTINRFLPAIVLREALTSAGLIPNDSAGRERLAEATQRGLNRLYPNQLPDGGWSWYGGDDSEPYLSAFVLHALQTVRRLGYSVPDYRIDRTVEYLKMTIYDSRDWDLTAYMLNALAETGNGIPELAEELYTNRNSMDGFTLALSALALKRMNEGGKADELAGLMLNRLSEVPGQGVALDADPQRYWSWNGSAAETTAWGLLALAEINPGDPAIPEMTRYLLRQRRGARWNSTRETGLVVEALSKVVSGEPAAALEGAAEYAVEVNGRPLAQGTIGKNGLIQPLSFPAESSWMRRGENQLRLTMNPPMGSWGLNANVFHHGRIDAPIPHDALEIGRTVERAIHTKDYRGRPKIVTDGISPDEELGIGQELLVTLRVTADRPLAHVIVEDPLPSGCEVIESFLDRAERGWNPYSRAERRDEKMVFFLDNLPEGDTWIEYLIRTELPGRFSANPSRVWCMYYPEVGARGASAEVRVEPPR